MFTNINGLLVTNLYFHRTIHAEFLFYFEPGTQLYIFMPQQFQHFRRLITDTVYRAAAVNRHFTYGRLLQRGHFTIDIRNGVAMRIGFWKIQEGIQAVYQPLYQRHLESLDIIRREARCDDGVVFFDLIKDGVEGYNKFIPYYLFPQSIYTVSVSTSSFRTKVSVGSNPWAVKPVSHNLATICERYGGGGHPGVGAISFEIGAIEQARKAAEEIAAELKS